MNITYKDTKELAVNDLQDLFMSVEWSSGYYPEKLTVAMKNSGSVFTAWHEDKLVGLVNALDDSVMTAYVHYLCVNPEYHGRGIGKELMRRITDKYKDYLRIVVISYRDEVGFYKNCGFSADSESVPMKITSLWT